MTELWARSANELAALIASRQVSSREVVDAHLARIEAADPTVHAFLEVTAERVRADAERIDQARAAAPGLGGKPAPELVLAVHLERLTAVRRLEAHALAAHPLQRLEAALLAIRDRRRLEQHHALPRPAVVLGGHGRTHATEVVPGVVWFSLKALFIFFLFAMAKAIVPRYRYDQLMRLGWKVFLPLSLAMVVIVAAVLQFGGLAPKG